MQDWFSAHNYAYTNTLSGRQWAWEFLRRNPDFKAAWRRSPLMKHLLHHGPHIHFLVGSIDPDMLAWQAV